MQSWLACYQSKVETHSTQTQYYPQYHGTDRDDTKVLNLVQLFKAPLQQSNPTTEPSRYMFGLSNEFAVSSHAMFNYGVGRLAIPELP